MAANENCRESSSAKSQRGTYQPKYRRRNVASVGVTNATTLLKESHALQPLEEVSAYTKYN